MAMRVQGPGGVVVEFPDGTDDATISKAMRQLPQDAAPAAPPEAKAGVTPPESVNPLADVAKSAGIGLVQGGLGLATLPGNLESLGRLGIDKAASALGFQNPELEKNNFLPTYNDAKSAIEKHTGEFYQPQTTAGKYARTIGEFAPTAVMGPGGVAARAVNVLAPAVASETAGELTEGTPYEPIARAVGGLLGPAIPNAAMRAITPITNDAARAAHVANLQNEGVTSLTAGQQTGNRAVRWAESTANDLPFNGGRGVALNDQAAEQFTAAALRRAGENANRATPDIIDGAFTRLGHQFDTLAARNTMRADPQFGQDLRTAVRDYFSVVPQSQRAPVVQDVVQDVIDTLQRTGGTISGDAYQALRSRLGTLARSTLRRDPYLSGTLSDIQGALDDAMARSAPAADQAAWQQARTQYRNLLAITKAMAGAGENTANGLISPAQLRTAVKAQNDRAYVRGQNDLGNLARSGEAIMKPLPNSGTPARLAAQHVISGIGAAAGGAVGNVPGAVVGAFAPALTQGAMARALMSAPVQGYLSNQALTPIIEAYNASRLPMAFRLPQAASDAVQPPTPLRGGIGPRYDANGNLIQGQ